LVRRGEVFVPEGAAGHLRRPSRVHTHHEAQVDQVVDDRPDRLLVEVE